MKLALFGATGATGRAILERAGRKGIAVHALVRPQSTLGGELPPTVSTIIGDLDSAEAIDRTLAGCDAACLVFGPRPPYTEIFCGDATERIMAGMRKHEMRRIVCQTGAMIGDYRRNRSRPFESAARLYRWRNPGPAADRVRQEVAVVGSNFDWTLIKPPRLTNARPSFRVEASAELRVGLLSSVARGDLADLILSALLNNRFMNSAVFVRKGRWHMPVPARHLAPPITLDALNGLPEESQALGVTDP